MALDTENDKNIGFVFLQLAVAELCIVLCQRNSKSDKNKNDGVTVKPPVN